MFEVSNYTPTHFFYDILSLSALQLYDKVYKERSTTNVDIGEWTPGSDGLPTRQLAYTLALNYSFGPKSTRAEEVQRHACQALPGIYYVVDASVYTEKVRLI